MKALTLKAPWATVIAKHGKDVENRSWKPPDSVIGERIAIHEGKKLHREHAKEAEKQVGGPVTCEHSVIVCTAIVQGWIAADGTHSKSLTSQEATRARRSKWYQHDVGWVLTGVREPAARVEIKGMLGLWTVPASDEKRLRGASKASTRPAQHARANSR